MPDVTLRPLRTEDLAEVASLGGELGYPGSAESYRARFDRVIIVGLVVGERHRRHGVGRALVKAVTEWTRKLGHTTIRVRSNAARVEAHDFYPALGFERTKTQHAYRFVLGD